MPKVPDMDGKDRLIINYSDFIKEISYRTGNDVDTIRCFMNTITDTIQDYISYVDENTNVVIRPMKGLRITAQKKLNAQHYHPVTGKPFDREVRVQIKSKLSNPLKEFDIEKHRQEFVGE